MFLYVFGYSGDGYVFVAMADQRLITFHQRTEYNNMGIPLFLEDPLAVEGVLIGGSEGN
jgi:hypothetical protein